MDLYIKHSHNHNLAGVFKNVHKMILQFIWKYRGLRIAKII